MEWNKSIFTLKLPRKESQGNNQKTRTNMLLDSYSLAMVEERPINQVNKLKVCIAVTFLREFSFATFAVTVSVKASFEKVSLKSVRARLMNDYRQGDFRSLYPQFYRVTIKLKWTEHDASVERYTHVILGSELEEWHEYSLRHVNNRGSVLRNKGRQLTQPEDY